MIDFLILYEIPNRELESDILLMKELNRRGFSTQLEVFPFVKIAQLRKKYQGNVRVLLIHSAYNEEVLFNLVYEVFGKVQKIVNLQWEQIRSKKWEDDYTSFLYPKGCARNVKHVCWGIRLAECLKKYGIEEKNIYLTGPMQMDTLRKEYDYLYISRRDLANKYGINICKRIVLIISSFSMVDAEERTIKEIMHNLGEEYVRYIIKISSESRSRLLQWIDKACSERTDCELIYRPHPEELKSSEIGNLQIKHENFKVISDYGVKQWIRIADKILVWNSTSAGEAFAAGKNFDVVRPINIGEHNNILFEYNKNYIESYGEFLKCINSDNGYDTSGIARYYDIGEKPAHVRLAERLEEYIRDRQDVFFWSKELIRKCRLWMVKKRMVHLLARIASPLDKYLVYMYKHSKHNAITRVFSNRIRKIAFRENRKKRFKCDEEKIYEKMFSEKGDLR